VWMKELQLKESFTGAEPGSVIDDFFSYFAISAALLSGTLGL